jgi:hypothetical protein
MESPFKIALAEKERELLELVEERLKIGERISKLLVAVRSMVHLLDNDIERLQHLRALEEIVDRINKPGLSQMICNTLFAFPNGLTQVQIRNALVSSGALDQKEYVNPAGSIHTTLRRLAESGTVLVKGRGANKLFKMAINEEKRDRSLDYRIKSFGGKA